MTRIENAGSASVVWLGDLPRDWKVMSLKWLASLRSGNAITSEDIEASGENPVFGGNGLRGYTGTYTHDGEYVLIGRQGALCGNINYASGRFWASEHAVVVAPREPVNVRWLGELLRFMNLNQHSVAAAQPGLALERIVDLRIPVPPLHVQQRIGEMLDRETARIDALIEKKTRFIELLREKRQALITHAVTRGLDSNASFTDSGVDWLGAIPWQWRVSPLKYLVSFQSGGTPSKDERAFWDGAIPWASAKDLKVDRLEDTQDHLTQHALDAGAASLVPAESVLVVVRGMILARTFPVTIAATPMAINQDLKALVATDRLNAGFLAYLLRGTASLSLARLEEAAHGTKALRMEAWTDIKLPVPPLHEQVEIVKRLDAGLRGLEDIAGKTMQTIDLLSERRAALITAAVTGQIDVRAEQPASTLEPQ